MNAGLSGREREFVASRPEELETLADVMDEAVRVHGDREAYVEGEHRITFAQWARSADGVAAELVDRGVCPGDVVALMLPSSIDYAVCYAAIARLGAVATGINTRLGSAEVGAILDQCRPGLVIRDIDLDLPPVRSGIPVLARSELADACRRPGSEKRGWQGQRTDPAVIIWTSGTTGVPKGAWFDHRSLAAARASSGVLSAPYDRRLVATPFAHAGYMAKLWDQLATGSTLVISPTPWSAAETLRLLVDERVTVAGAVPTQWAKLLELPGIETADLSHLRLGVSATAPAPPELVERVVQWIGCPLVVRYAMTESPSITGTEPEDAPEVQYRTVGRPQAGMEVTLTDHAGAPVSNGDVGQVRVRGTCVMRGYWGAPELTAKVLSSDGWLTSSDLGFFTPEGNLVLTGRSSDLYIRGGYNVYPLEVEHVLAEHPAVGRVAVVGTPAPVIGEVGVAFVVPSDSAHPPTLAHLRELARRQLADYKAPDRLELVDELPLTDMLKIDKDALRARLADE